MVCAGVKGVLLMALLSLMATGGQGVESLAPDATTLAKIIQYIKTEYQPTGQTDSGGDIQFAAAINVPHTDCVTYQNNFLSGESDSVAVKQKLSTEQLYQGTKLVVATPKNVGSGAGAVHSERSLLMCEDNNHGGTPMENLLRRDANGCAVFYTYNSPCLQYCLNQDKDDNERNRERKQNERNEKNRQHNERNSGTKQKKIVEVQPAVQKCILNSLNVLTNHQGLKAFVFSQVYEKDINNEKLAAALRVVAEKVPLFRCSGSSCVQCLSGNQIVSDCLSN